MRILLSLFTTLCQILSESAAFCKRYDIDISAYLLLEHDIGMFTNTTYSFTR